MNTHTEEHSGIPVRERRFLRYVTVGVGTFLVDLLLLFLFIEVAHLHYTFATATAFFLAVSLNYLISRQWVFSGSERAVVRGYVYFLQWAGLGMLLTVFLMWCMTTYTAWHFVLIRISVAGVVGMMNYLGNLYYTFKVAGENLD